MANCCGQETYTDTRPAGDRRLQLIQQIKEFLGDIEHEEGGRARNAGHSEPRGCARSRDMEEECRQYRKRKDCSPPTITSIAIHEIRPTSNYDQMRHENSSQVTFVDATKPTDSLSSPMPPAPWELPRTPSQELRAGTLYPNCECTKRNGLQQDCPRWECGGRPECVAVNPGPCCAPSQARKPVRGDRRVRGTQRSPGKEDKNIPSPQTGSDMPIANSWACLCQPVTAPLQGPHATGGEVSRSVDQIPTGQDHKKIGQMAHHPFGTQLHTPHKTPLPTKLRAEESPRKVNLVCFCETAEKGGPQTPIQAISPNQLSRQDDSKPAAVGCACLYQQVTAHPQATPATPQVTVKRLGYAPASQDPRQFAQMTPPSQHSPNRTPIMIRHGGGPRGIDTVCFCEPAGGIGHQEPAGATSHQHLPHTGHQYQGPVTTLSPAGAPYICCPLT